MLSYAKLTAISLVSIFSSNSQQDVLNVTLMSVAKYEATAKRRLAYLGVSPCIIYLCYAKLTAFLCWLHV